MTNRDPNVTEFNRKFNEYHKCLANYYVLSNESKLKADLEKPDIELTCKYELEHLKRHVRKYNGTNHNDFVKYPNLHQDQAFLNNLGLDLN